MTDDLTTRLQRSTEGVGLTDEVRAAHLASIDAALGAATVTGIGDAPSRRRKIVAGLVAAALIGPTGLAAASSDALPGDTLYGVKQVSEQVASVFDPEIVARNRVAEAEALASLGRVDDASIERAREAVSDLSDDHALRARLAALLDDDDDDDDDEPTMVTPDDDDASESDDDELGGDDATDTEGDDDVSDDESPDSREPAAADDSDGEDPATSPTEPVDDDEPDDDESEDDASDDDDTAVDDD